MKNISLITSLFFSALAAAAPLKQRDYATQVVADIKTVVVLTTVWLEPGETPPPQVAAQAMSFHPGQFGYKAPDVTSSSSAPIYTPPPAVQATTSSVSPPPPPPPPPAVVTTQQAAPSVPQPTLSTQQPVPAPSSASAAKPSGGAPVYSGPMGSVGEKHDNVRLSPMWTYPTNNIDDKMPAVNGACNTDGIDKTKYLMSDKANARYVALAASEFNVAYCGKNIKITNSETGQTTTAIIADRCGDCGSYGAYSIDILKAPWAEVGKGLDVFKGSWEIIG